MVYLVLLILSFILTYLIKNYALKKALVAQVNERSSHSIPTPHGGGIAIAVVWTLGLLYLFIYDKIDSTLFWALLIGLVISVVSFFDDIYELSAKVRLVVQSVVSILGLYIIGGLNSLSFGLFEITNPIISNMFAFFLLIWFINLTNFIDGINGYVGSEFVFLSIAGVIIFGGEHFIVLGVAVLGFLFWNWNNAKIFMGDVGSTLLGYTIAIFTLYYANMDALNLWVWITLFGLFWFDATLTLLRRKLNGEKISVAHKKHAYQRLTQANWSHFKVTNYAIVVNMILFLIVYSLNNIAISFALAMIILYSCMLFVDKKKDFK